MNEEIKPKPVIEVKPMTVQDIVIPQCCLEGWKSCKHVVKPTKPIKRNIGL